MVSVDGSETVRPARYPERKEVPYALSLNPYEGYFLCATEKIFELLDQL